MDTVELLFPVDISRKVVYNTIMFDHRLLHGMRKSAGLSFAELSAVIKEKTRVWISPQMLAKYEQGSIPSADRYYAICLTFGIEMNEMVSLEGLEVEK